MKIAVALSGVLIAAFAFAAYGCSASSPAADDPGTGQDASTGSSGSSGSSSGSSSSSSSSSGSSGAPDAGSTAACGQACATDQDCQKWCAPVNNGLNCCDSTHVCFQWSGNSCPAQAQDSGTTPPY